MCRAAQDYLDFALTLCIKDKLLFSSQSAWEESVNVAYVLAMLS